METPHSSAATAQAKANFAALESWLSPLFAKAPHLPPQARAFLVSIAPWLALLGGVLGILGIFPIIGGMFMATSMPFAQMMGGWYSMMVITTLIMGIAAVLDLLAVKPLLAHKKSGWNLLFYSATLSVLSSIVSLVFGSSGFLSGLIGALIGYWLLFEIREMYKA